MTLEGGDVTNATENRAEQQARAQLASIMGMVQRLQHAQECDGGEDCELSDEEILEGLDFSYSEGMTASAEQREQYHDEDQAREAIEEDALSVEVRSDWHTPGQDEGPAEYNILLCTGGPACRIRGELDEWGQPKSAKLQYQDWSTPWENYRGLTDEEFDALLTYAQQFYWGG